MSDNNGIPNQFSPPQQQPLTPEAMVSPSSPTNSPVGPAAKPSLFKRKFLKLPLWSWLVIGLLGFLAIGAASGGSKDKTDTAAADKADTSATSTQADAATTAGGTASAAPTTPGSTAPAGDVGSRSNPVPIGQSAEVGNGWSMTVDAVNLDATAEVAAANEFNQPAPEGMTYVLISTTLAYNGDDESDSTGVSIAVVGEGTNSKTDISTQQNLTVAPEPALASFTEVFKGGSIQGNTVLAVPTVDLPTLVIIGHAYTSFDDDDRKFFATS